RPFQVEGERRAEEVVAQNAVVAASHVALLRVDERGVGRVRPKGDGDVLAPEAVEGERVVLAVFDGDAALVAREVVAEGHGVVAVASPNRVERAVNPVADEGVAAKGRLDTVRRGVAKVV